jgi:hypothetical protein
MDKISLYDGKYEVIHNSNPYEFKALRYGEPWRDLCGDNLILQMFFRILELEEENKKMQGGIK